MKPLFRLVCFFLMLSALSADVWARGSRSGGGGSRSSSSRSSFSSGSSSRSSGGSYKSSSGWGGSSRFSGSSSSSSNSSSNTSPNRSSSGWGTSTSSSSNKGAPISSSSDRALARKVGEGGAKYSNRSDAVRDFQQKHASEYSSRFPSEPSSRPSHIPGSTTVNGQSYPVQYDSNQGGYGSWVGNRWSAYDVMRDSLMLNALMGQRNYTYYDSGPGNSYGNGSRSNYYRQQSGSSFLGGLVMLIILAVLVIAAVVAFKYWKARKASDGDPFLGGGSTSKSAQGQEAFPPARNLSTSPMDKSKAADWLAILPNSIVTVSDEQGIADSMKRGLGVRGIDYTVKSVAEMKQVDGLSTHLLLTLHDEEQAAFLLVKVVDEHIDLGLYIEVDALAPGSRQELVNRGDLWLFQEPPNPNNYQVSDLRYTTSIKQSIPTDNGGSEEVLYEMKQQGELQCEYREKPARTGMSDSLATIVEYATSQEVENPELLVLEVGSKRGTSSYVQFYLGCPVKFSEIDVLPA